MGKFALWPELASNFAFEVDALYIFINLVCLVFGLGVFLTMDVESPTPVGETGN
jgi:hypothetical protein